MRYDMRSETKVSDTDQLHTAPAPALSVWIRTQGLQGNIVV